MNPHILDLILEEYDNGKSLSKISKQIGLSRPTISKHLKRSGRIIRKSSEYLKGNKRSKVFNITKEELLRQYIDQNLTISEVAHNCNISEETIRLRLKKFNIYKPTDVIQKRISDRSKQVHHKEWKNKEFLYQEYIVKQKSINQLSKELQSTDNTIKSYLNKFNIPTRKLQEANQLAANTEEGRELRSKITKEAWKDKEFRQKVINGIKKAGWKPTFTREDKKRLSETAKMLWRNHDYRYRNVKTHKENVDIKQVTEASHSFWGNKEKVEAWYSIVGSLEKREKVSRRSLLQWSDQKFLDKLPEIKKKLSEIAKKKWQDSQYRHKNLSNRKTFTSSLEYTVRGILDDLHIPYKKIRIGGYEFDLLIDSKYCNSNKHLLIEINGAYFHQHKNNQNIIKRDKERYLYWKENLKHTYNFEMIREYEFGARRYLFDKLVSMLNLTIDGRQFKFPDLEIKRVSKDDALSFLNKYHYLERRLKIGNYIGCYFGNILIAVTIFSGITRKESADRLKVKTSEIRELSRFCISPIYNKKNFGSWFMSKAIKNFVVDNNKIKKLITFADTTVGHTGSLYKACNWKEDGETKPSYYYENDGYYWHKKTIWDLAKSCGMKENEFVEVIGLNKIKTKKKKRFLYDIL